MGLPSERQTFRLEQKKNDCKEEYHATTTYWARENNLPSYQTGTDEAICQTSWGWGCLLQMHFFQHFLA